MLHIYGHSWPVRWGKPGEPKEILVYSNCPEVELFVNGVSQGRKKRNSQTFRQQGCAGMCHYEKETTRLPPRAMTASCASTMKFSRSIKPEPGANRQEYF